MVPPSISIGATEPSAATWKTGGREEPDVVAAVVAHRADTGDGLSDHVRVRQHRTLGCTRRSGRVENQGRCVLGQIDGCIRLAGLRHEFFVTEHVGFRVGADVHDQTQFGNVLTHRRDQRCERGLGEHRTSPAVTGDERDLGRGEPEVDGNRDGTEGIDRENRFEEFGAVEGEQQNTVAEVHTAAGQRAGERLRSVVQFAPGRTVAEKAERGLIGLHLRVRRNPVVPVVAAGLQWLLQQLAT